MDPRREKSPPDGSGGQMNGVRRVHGRRKAVLGAVVVTLLLVACGDSSDPVAPDPAVAPFVGDWNATALVITSVANPDIHPDLIALGATFTINVQPSGQYTAILIYAGQPSTQIGQVTVSGSSITLHPQVPAGEPDATSAYSFPDANHLVLDGETEFDFNLDGTNEPAVAHIELARK